MNSELAASDAATFALSYTPVGSSPLATHWGTYNDIYYCGGATSSVGYWHVWISVPTTECTCAVGYSGSNCQKVGGADDCAADVGDGFLAPTADSSNTYRCGGPGLYVPGGSVGASCSLFKCAVGTTDHDRDSSTPCQECDTTAGAPSEGHYGPCEDAIPPEPMCNNWGVEVEPTIHWPPRSCTDHWLAGNRTNGAYKVQPTPLHAEFDVLCDFTTDGEFEGAWTLVGARQGGYVSDTGLSMTGNLGTTSPTTTEEGIFSGFVPAVNAAGGRTDMRFECEGTSDIVVRDVDWYVRMVNSSDDEENRLDYKTLRAGGVWPEMVELHSGSYQPKCRRPKVSWDGDVVADGLESPDRPEDFFVAMDGRGNDAGAAAHASCVGVRGAGWCPWCHAG